MAKKRDIPNKWRIGDICWISGSTGAEIISNVWSNGCIDVDVFDPSPHSRFKKGEEATLPLKFIHKQPHRRKDRYMKGTELKRELSK